MHQPAAPQQRAKLTPRCKAFAGLDSKDRLLDTLTSHLVVWNVEKSRPCTGPVSQVGRFVSLQGGRQSPLLVVSNDPTQKLDDCAFAYSGTDIGVNADFLLYALDLESVGKADLIDRLRHSLEAEADMCALRTMREREKKRRQRSRTAESASAV